MFGRRKVGKAVLFAALFALLPVFSAEARERGGRRRHSSASRNVRRAVRLEEMMTEMNASITARHDTGPVTVSDGITTLVICPGMSTALVNGEAIHAKGLVGLHDNDILVPADLASVVREIFRKAGLMGLRKIVIDAGHGGKDPGAIGKTGLKEKVVTLSVVLRLARILRERGVDVILTRDSDVFVSLDERVRICNRANPDLFLSIHANSHWSKTAHGVETFFVRESIDDLARAKRALRGGEIVQGVRLRKEDTHLGLALYHTLYDVSRRKSLKIGKKVQNRVYRCLGTPDRGVKEAGFRVLKGAMCPALLVELGFLSKSETEHNFRNPKVLDKIAKSIAAAL